FESHSFNVQSGVTVIELSDIHSTKGCWSKFLGFIPLLPNGLSVYTKTGVAYSFVLFGRGAWAAAIDSATRN
ncbi:MAG: hypothetical protein VB814_05880, partial [Pirellulaceae bacterium]